MVSGTATSNMVIFFKYSLKMTVPIVRRWRDYRLPLLSPWSFRARDPEVRSTIGGDSFGFGRFNHPLGCSDLFISLSFPWPDTPAQSYIRLVSTTTLLSYLNALCSCQRCILQPKRISTCSIFSIYLQFCCFLSNHGWWMSGSGSHARMNSSNTAHLQCC